MTAFVYQSTRAETGDFYIGITNNFRSRIRSHECSARKNSQSHFHKALRKYGDGNFEWEIRAQLPTTVEAQIAERILIALEEPHYNESRGGDGAWGVKQSAETIKKRSIAMTGRTHTDETKAKIAAGNLGKTVSASTRAKIGAKSAGRKTFLGKAHTEETKAKISATKTGTKASPETRAAQSAAHTARWARIRAAKLTAQEQV